MSNPAKRWVFTLNNYTDEDISALADASTVNGGETFSYLVFGREVGESGIPYL